MKGKAMSEKFNQIKYQNEYNKEKYQRVELNLKKGEKELFQEWAEKKGYKKKEFSKYVKDLIYQDMNGGGTEKELSDNLLPTDTDPEPKDK